MAQNDVDRPSFDRETLVLCGKRLVIWLVNLFALSILPVLAITAEGKGWFEGAELSGITAGLLTFSALNLLLSVNHAARVSITPLGKGEFWVILALALVLLAYCVGDTYTQAVAKHSLIAAFGVAFILMCVALSAICEIYIAVVERDKKNGGVYVVTTVQHLHVGSDGVRLGTDVVSHIRRS